jgi:hypothetical protein
MLNGCVIAGLVVFQPSLTILRIFWQLLLPLGQTLPLGIQEPRSGRTSRKIFAQVPAQVAQEGL